MEEKKNLRIIHTSKSEKKRKKKENDRSARNGSREGNFEIDLKIERILPAALGG